MDFLKNLKLDDHEQNAHNTSNNNHHGSQHGSNKGQGLFDKIGDAIGADTHDKHPPAPTSEVPKKEGLFGKLEDVLHQGHKSQTYPVQPSASKHEGLLGQLGDALSGGSASPHQNQNEKPNGLLGKIGTVIGGERKEEKPQGLNDKINSVLGGGSAGEQKEDYLDKAIDLFQEHVMKAGPQNNESAIEQMKDAQIANAIKSQFHKVTGADHAPK